MSAHLPTLLLYTPQRPAWLGKLRGSLTPLGVRLRAVTAEELDAAVGTLAGLTELTAGEDPAGEAPEEVAEPVLVLCHMPDSGLNALLNKLRQAGVPRSVLKAVLTPSNAAWSFRALYGELCLERRAMAGDETAHPAR